MRLWHIDILPYLPNSQLIAQKREIDLIWKDIAEGRKTNHILINYIWEYENYEAHLFVYYLALYKEFEKRHFKFNRSKYCNIKLVLGDGNPFPKHHDKRYLLQCFYNLQEKYDRGQKDFDDVTYKNLQNFVSKTMEEIFNECK